MEHQHINDNKLIDKYILHQLNHEEETELEEHFLYCESCTSTLETRKKLIGLIKHAVPENLNHKVDNKQSKKLKTLFFVRLAASIIVIVSLSWISMQFFSTKSSGKKISSVSGFNLDSIYINKPDSLNKQIKPQEKQELLASSFRTLPIFENYIQNPTRAAELTVISPIINEKFNHSKWIKFVWQSAQYNALNLVVFSNVSEIISEDRIDTNFVYTQKLKPGLYYWQLETTNEAIFTGKFIVSKK